MVEQLWITRSLGKGWQRAMNLTLAQLADLVDGTLSGDPSLEITGAATLSAARPGDITLCDSPKLAPQLARCPAAAVVVSDNYQPTDRPTITVASVHGAFAKIVAHYRPLPVVSYSGVHPAAYVSPTAQLADNVEVHPHASIGNHCVIGSGTVIHSGVRVLDGTTIGDNCTLFPNVVLYENTILGNRVMIHSGSVIGAFGFGYSTKGGEHHRSAQLGYVEIEDDVEVGACTTIDRGTYGPTLIGRGSKIDNQVQIAHNVRLGTFNLVCSQVGMAGSCSTGDYVVLAGQVGVRDHVHVGSRAVIGAKGGVMGDIPEDGRFFGIPVTEEKQQFSSLSIFHRLPELRKQLIEVKRDVSKLMRDREQASIPGDAPMSSDLGPKSEAA